MEKVCGECIYLDYTNKEKYSSKDKFYCLKGRGYREPTERACHYDYTLNQNIYNNGGYKPSGCYITTIVCNILGYDDNCELLQTLRQFRENILRPNPDYLPLLIQYDQIGPLISEKITNSDNPYDLALNILIKYLLPVSSYIKEKNYQVAIKLYTDMVNCLTNYFHIIEPTLNINIEDINKENVGKGRILKNIKSKL